MTNHSKRSRLSCRGLSLVEVVLGVAVLGLTASAGYNALRTSIFKLEQIQTTTSKNADETTALWRMAGDLRCAYLAVDDQRLFFAGHRAPAIPGDQLDFSRPDEFDVRYILERNTETLRWDLWRFGKEKTLLCPDARSFRVRYCDGEAWTDQWGWDEERQQPTIGIRGLPLAVSIELNGKSLTIPIMTALINRGFHA